MMAKSKNPKPVGLLQTSTASPLEKSDEPEAVAFCNGITDRLQIAPERLTTSRIYVIDNDMLQRTIFLDDREPLYFTVEGDSYQMPIETWTGLLHDKVIAALRVLLGAE